MKESEHYDEFDKLEQALKETAEAAGRVVSQEPQPREKKEGAKRGRKKKEVEGVGTHVVYLPDDAYFALLQYKARARQRGGTFQSLGAILAEAAWDMIRKEDRDLFNALQNSKL